jgi:hypothetical protein
MHGLRHWYASSCSRVRVPRRGLGVPRALRRRLHDADLRPSHGVQRRARGAAISAAFANARKAAKDAGKGEAADDRGTRVVHRWPLSRCLRRSAT